MDGGGLRQRETLVPCDQVEAAVAEDERALARAAAGMERVLGLVNLAVSRYSRFRCGGGDQDRDAAVARMREALSLLGPTDPSRAALEGNLAMMLAAGSASPPSTADEQVARTAPDSVERGEAALQAATAHYHAFTAQPSRQRLDEAERHAREAVRLLPVTHREGAVARLNLIQILASSLSVSKADGADRPRLAAVAASVLADAKTLLTEVDAAANGRRTLADPTARAGLVQVLTMLQPLQPDLWTQQWLDHFERQPHDPAGATPLARMTEFDAVAGRCLHRYFADGSREQLRDAIGWQYKAARAAPDQQRSRVLTNLSVCLLLAHRGGLDDEDSRVPAEDRFLRLAAVAAEAALPDADDLNRPLVLAQLGDCLLYLYRDERRPADLAGAEEALRRSEALMSPGAPERAALGSLLGTLELAQAAQQGSVTQAERGVAALRAALAQYEPGSTLALVAAFSVADGLLTIARLTGDHMHRTEAAEASRRACRNGLDRVADETYRGALLWGNVAWEERAWADAAEAYGFAVAARRRVTDAQARRVDAT